MSSDLSINIFQFDIQWLDPKENIRLINNHVQSIEDSVDLVVLPEMFLSGFCMEASRSAIKEESAEISQLINLAQVNKLALIGSLAIEENNKFYNRVLLITGNGISGRYDKQRLYSPSGENQAFSSKYDTNLIEYKGWNILPQVCYDLRFPENVRPLPAPDLLIYMANWPTPRIHHWDTLIRARAIENQCFTIGCNRVGTDGNDWEYPGHSAIIGPDGAILKSGEAATSESIHLSKNQLTSYRSKYRFLEDK